MAMQEPQRPALTYWYAVINRHGYWMVTAANEHGYCWARSLNDARHWSTLHHCQEARQTLLADVRGTHIIRFAVVNT